MSDRPKVYRRAEAPERDVEATDVPPDVGYDETNPAQTEIIAGTPEHEAVLNQYPNASSYGPDINVVIVEEVPEEPPPDPPVVPPLDDETIVEERDEHDPRV